MNKRLEELFNMKPENNKSLTSSELSSEEKNYLIKDSDQNIDEIKYRALETYKDLIESGFSCDPKHASNFLEPAAKILEIALNAEKIKIDKKLESKKIKLTEERLKLMKRKIDIEEKNTGNILELNDEGVYVDRNELLKKLLDK